MRLYEFLNKHSLIAPAQYGFLKGKSTELALLTQKEYIINQLEGKNIVLGLYLDFSKAFDCINHNILLSKLKQYGVRGDANALLCSYLQHRFQYVSHYNANSQLRCITCGVPKAAFLGLYCLLSISMTFLIFLKMCDGLAMQTIQQFY